MNQGSEGCWWRNYMESGTRGLELSRSQSSSGGVQSQHYVEVECRHGFQADLNLIWPADFKLPARMHQEPNSVARGR